MNIARIIRVEGRVQGVCYRDWTVETAGNLGLTGWVRNRRDGSVEVMTVGQAAAMERFTQCLREGPAAARVDRVQVAEVPVQEFGSFARRPTE